MKKTGDYFMEDPQGKSEDDYLDEEYESNENTADEDIPVDEDFWEDELLFEEDENVFEDEGFSEEELPEDDLDEGFTEEDFEETEQNSIGQFGAHIKEVIDGMKEKGTLIPAAVSIGAALVLLVLSLGRKKNK